jgi:hypothetical protein
MPARHRWTREQIELLRALSMPRTLSWTEVAARVSAIGAPRSAMSCILLCRRLESK